MLQPAAIKAALKAQTEQARRQDDVLAALDKDLQATRYAAARAAKQYDAADPANRLVADELERRWNAALERVSEIEQRMELARSQQTQAVPAVSDLQNLAEDLETVRNNPGADARLKKRLILRLIHEIVVDIDETMAEVVLVIH